MTTKPIGDDPVAWLDDDEAVEFFDRNSHSLMGMSGLDFLRRWDAGEWRDGPDDAEHSNVIRLSMLIPFGRRRRP